MQTYLRDCRWGRFLLLRGDMISQNVDVWGEWAEAEVTLFRSLLSRRANVVEVGSNIGMHAVPLAIHCAEGKIYCHEPQRPLFHILCANVALNNLLNVVARHCAAGERDGFAVIQTSAYDEPWNYGSFSIAEGFNTEGRYAAPVGQEKVAVLALDADPLIASAQKIDLIKIDVEGYEVHVVRGARGLIAKHRPYVFIEANREAVVAGVLAEMNSLGYGGYWYCASRYRRDNFNQCHWVKTDAFDPNILFTPNEIPAPAGLVPVRGFADLNGGLPIYSD
jgi:FkbM family methyltransferase